MTQILLTKGVTEYRKTIPLYINKRDIVLEIGFAWGTTTNLLSKHCRQVVGIDKGDSYLSAIAKYPDLKLYRIDGFNISRVIDLGYKFNKSYIDISGCCPIINIIKIVRMYETVYSPELIVVKNTKLKSFIGKCTTFDKLVT